MFSRVRSSLTYANVMSTLCFFILIGGTSYAALSLPKKGVKSKHLASNAVTSPKVKNGALLAEDFAPGQIPAGAQGAQGPRGDTGPQGERGIAGPIGPVGPAGRDGADGAGVNWRGEWDSNGVYGERDVVSHRGSSYIATGPAGSTPPPGDPWDLVASKGDAGATGETGTDGKSIVWKGSWQAGTAYRPQDAVSRNGSSFIAKGDSTGADPLSSPASWDPLATKGDAGAAGATGGTGPQGPQGPQGPTGPSDAYAVTASANSAEFLGNGPAHSLTLSGLPAGSYVISAKAYLTAGAGATGTAICGLPPKSFWVSQANFEPSTFFGGTYAEFEAQTVHVFTTTGTVQLTCQAEVNWRFAANSQITAVRVGNLTASTQVVP